MQGILRKAEIWDERATLFEINPRTRKRLADASQVLTTRIRQEWQQGKDLVFHLDHGGNEDNKIDVSIQDPSVQRQYVQRMATKRCIEQVNTSLLKDGIKIDIIS